MPGRNPVEHHQLSDYTKITGCSTMTRKPPEPLVEIHKALIKLAQAWALRQPFDAAQARALRRQAILLNHKHYVDTIVPAGGAPCARSRCCPAISSPGHVGRRRLSGGAPAPPARLDRRPRCIEHPAVGLLRAGLRRSPARRHAGLEPVGGLEMFLTILTNLLARLEPRRHGEQSA